jgi:hypothetical protein
MTRVGWVTVGDRSLVRTLVVASGGSRYRTWAMSDFIAAARRSDPVPLFEREPVVDGRE